MRDKHEGKENPATKRLGLKSWAEGSTRHQPGGAALSLRVAVNACSPPSDSLGAERYAPGPLQFDLRDRHMTSLQDF